jgi:hypothetical protein
MNSSDLVLSPVKISSGFPTSLSVPWTGMGAGTGGGGPPPSGPHPGNPPPVLRSVDRSVRLGQLGVCPECQMAEVGKSWTITESV